MPHAKNYVLFLVQRFFIFIAMLVILPALLYAFVNATPSDPRGIPPEAADLIPDQTYGDWLGDALSGDFGTSFRSRQPVDELISERLPNSLELFIPAFFISLVLGVGLGVLVVVFLHSEETPVTRAIGAIMTVLTIWIIAYVVAQGAGLIIAMIVGAILGGLSGLRPQVIPDIIIRGLSLFATSMPIFWLGMLLIYEFAFRRESFPIGGRCPATLSGDCTFSDRLDYMVLPVASLAVFGIGTVALYTRRFLLDLLASAPEGKSVTEVVVRGVLLAPILAIPAMVRNLIGGLILVEILFAYPGLGRLLYDGLINRDYPVLLGAAFVLTVAVIVIYFVCHVLFGLLAMGLGIKPDGYLVTTNYQLQAVSEEQTFSQPRRVGAIYPLLPILGTVLAIIAGLVLVGIFFSTTGYSDDDGVRQSISDRLLPRGSDDFPLGTDELGRDFQARLMLGTRNSLQIAVIATIISMAIGVIAGLVGGVADGIIGRILNIPLDILLAIINGIPLLLLLLVIRATADIDFDHNMGQLTVLLGVWAWIHIPPFVRAWLRRVRRDKRYQTGEDQLNSGVVYVFLSFCFLMGFIFVSQVAFILLLETGLSFLGIGILPPTPSLGSLLSNSLQYMRMSPHLMTLPGTMLTVIIFCLAILAARFRSMLNITPPDWGTMLSETAVEPSHLDEPSPETYNAPSTEGI